MAEPVSLPPVSVAGLEIPADVAPQIITAFRTLYPTITAGKDDDAAVRATLLWFITSTLETHAVRQDAQAMDAAIAEVQAKGAARAALVRQQIQAATQRIREKDPAPSGSEGTPP